MNSSISASWTRIVAGAFYFGTLLLGLAQPAPTNLWKLRLPLYHVYATPAIGLDGIIYQATFSGFLLAVTPGGKTLWQINAGSEINSSPAIADDGTIYFGARNRKLYAVTPGGKIKWTFSTGAWNDSSPAIGADGTVYFGSWDNNIYALNPDGTKKWVFATSNIVESSPAIGYDGTIYFGSHDKQFYALKPDGGLLWRFATGAPVISSPAIGSDGTIYFVSTDGNFYALRPDGSERWHLHTGGVTRSSPVLDGQGLIYLGVNADCVAIDESGQKKWAASMWSTVDSTTAVDANSLVYCASRNGRLAGMMSNGTVLWRQQYDGGEIHASPMLGGDGIIYLPDAEYLRAIAPANPVPPANSSWPMFRANARHTGRVQPVN
jgi:outer membrane protein assembly factor BamB